MLKSLCLKTHKKRAIVTLDCIKRALGPSLPLIPILQMTEKEYRKHFHENQIGEWWVSFGAVQRNAAVALGNIGDPRAVLVLSSVLRRGRSFIVRGHAAWALGKIGGQDARLALKEAPSREKNPAVRVEIENALKSRSFQEFPRRLCARH